MRMIGGKSVSLCPIPGYSGITPGGGAQWNVNSLAHLTSRPTDIVDYNV